MEDGIGIISKYQRRVLIPISIPYEGIADADRPRWHMLAYGVKPYLSACRADVLILIRRELNLLHINSFKWFLQLSLCMT